MTVGLVSDDIPIQAGQVVPTDSNDMLSCITEEGEAEGGLQRGAGTRASKPKLTSFPALGKKSKESKDKTTNATDKKVTLRDSSKAIWNSLSGGGDSVEPRAVDEANGSMKDELSLASGHTSTDNSDSRSQATADSLDMDPTPRFAAMQVSSV